MIIRHKLSHLISQIIISCMQTDCKQDTQLLPDIRNERYNAASAQSNAAVPDAYTVACRGVREGQARTKRRISVVYARRISVVYACAPCSMDLTAVFTFRQLYRGSP
jgi:predicted SprT family Zn-dependent metalloprotease